MNQLLVRRLLNRSAQGLISRFRIRVMSVLQQTIRGTQVSSRKLLTLSNTHLLAFTGCQRITLSSGALWLSSPRPTVLVPIVRCERAAAVTERIEKKWSIQYWVWYIYDWTMSLLRGVSLILAFSPVLIIAPLSYFYPPWQPQAIKMLLWSIQWAGPTFIKLGQWASTRPDLLPNDLCKALEDLQSGIAPHSYIQTKKILEEDFGTDLIFVDIDPKPIGSGCIAQVYKATILDETGQQLAVAVKVRHPGVETTIRRDIRLMNLVASVIEWLLPSYKWLGVSDVVANFAQVMFSQLDMRVEAKNLEKFGLNFKEEKDVIFPKPVHPWISDRVLVETFEEGVPISNFKKGDKYSDHIAKIGLDSFLVMVLSDNFVHGDLHPGNLLVKISQIEKKRFFGPPRIEPFVQLIILDAGLIVELSPTEQKNFRALFEAVMWNNGRLAAELMIDRSRIKEFVVDREGFIEEMTKIISQVRSQAFRPEAIQIGEILNKVMSLLRHHRIRIESDFSNLVMGIIILEGLGRALDPNIDIFERAQRVLKNPRGIHPQYEPYPQIFNVFAYVLLNMRKVAREIYMVITSRASEKNE